MTKSFGTAKKLIIADDDEDDQSLLKEIITDYCSLIKTISIPDGKKLMEHLSAKDLPDLLFLDLNMPYKTGIECLTEIRASKRLKKIPVVILTTSKSKSDIDLCYALGAQLFYSKPNEIETLKKLIHSVLEIDWSLFERPPNKEEFAKIAIGRKLIH